MTFSPAFSRLISRRTLAGTPNFFKSTTPTRRIITTAPAPIEPVISSPWMMLPPSFNGDTVSYNFYILAENSIRTFPQTELAEFGPNPTRHVFIRGSSHGWLAIFNRDRDRPDVFLYDPISLRRINLPPIDNLIPKDPKCNTIVHKLILTSSPDEEEEEEHNSSCLAVMICNYKLFFCCPGRSSEWTPFGMWDDRKRKSTLWKRYEDIVYSEKQNLIFTLDDSNELVEAFDLAHPWKKVKKLECVLYSMIRPFSSAYRNLVVDKDDDVVLLVTRYMLDSHRTIDFDVRDEDGSRLDSLGDRAVFIGPPSESVVLSASRFPELKPNSIYFTDQFQTSFPRGTSFGGDDIGIFDYGNKTVSSCYYPCDVRSQKGIVPSPVWFHPRGPV